MKVWSIGHSTHGLDELVELLREHRIGAVADIRTVPKSRRHPHFGSESLAQGLPERGVAYSHLRGLGGFRRPHADSPNGGWRNESFRGYADYAMTEEFAAALAELRRIARSERTAMMCSEGLWWRCHRRLVADRLVVAGDAVLHVAPDGRTSEHELTPMACVADDGQITYPVAG